MIVKYLVFKNNWHYIDASEFMVNHIYFDVDLIEHPNIDQIQDRYKKLREIIENETGATTESKISFFNGDKEITMINECTVVVPIKNEDAVLCVPCEVLALCNPAYLMTDYGKTIERIA